MNAIQGDIYCPRNPASSRRVFFFNILCTLESPRELFLETHRGYDLTGLKWDGPNDLAQPTTTSLRGKVGASSFIKTQ